MKIKIKDENLLKKQIDMILRKLILLKRYFNIYKGLTKEQANNNIINEYFFTQDLLYILVERIILESYSIIYDKDLNDNKSCSIRNLLIFYDKHKVIFKQKKYYYATNLSKNLDPRDKIRIPYDNKSPEECIDNLRIDFDKYESIKKTLGQNNLMNIIKEIRDKQIAHFDKKHYIVDKKRAYKIKIIELEKIIDIFFEDMNQLSYSLYGKQYILSNHEEEEIDYMAEILKNSKGGI